VAACQGILVAVFQTVSETLGFTYLLLWQSLFHSDLFLGYPKVEWIAGVELCVSGFDMRDI